MPDILEKIEQEESIEEKKKRLEILLHEKKIRLCRNDCDKFIDYIDEDNPDWLGQSDLHIRWNKVLTEHKFNLLICPREHGKTSQIIRRIIFELGKNPNLRVKLVCNSDDTAVKRLTAIIDLIDNNPRVQEVFPDLKGAQKGTWTKSKIYVERTSIGLIDPSVEACGILSTGTGGRADLLVFDDPVDFRNAIQQPALREVVKEAYKNVWMNILTKDGRVWYIATPWHKDDLTLELLEKDDEYNKITDSIDENFTPIWEEQWKRSRLVNKLNSIGKRAFDKGFRNKVLSEEDAIFTQVILDKCFEDSFTYGGLPPYFKKDNVRYFAGIDIASGKSKSKNAYSVMFTIAEQDKIKIPVSIIRGKYSSPVFTKMVIEELLFYNHELIFVENNNVQEALMQWMLEVSSDIAIPPMRGYFTGMQKMDSEIGLPGLAVEMEHGTWKIPDFKNHEKICKCSICLWVNELLDYPVGKFSDIVMGSWFAREAARSLTIKMPRITVIGSGDDDD